MLLALKVEQELTKDEILELYVNIMVVRQTRLRRASGSAHVLRQAGGRVEPAATRHARRHHQKTGRRQPHQRPGVGAQTSQPRAAADVPTTLHQRAGVPRRGGGADHGASPSARHRLAGALSGGVGAATALRALRRGHLHRLRGLHHPRHRASGSRANGGERRADRVRPAPWLSRAGGPHRRGFGRRRGRSRGRRAGAPKLSNGRPLGTGGGGRGRREHRERGAAERRTRRKSTGSVCAGDPTSMPMSWARCRERPPKSSPSAMWCASSGRTIVGACGNCRTSKARWWRCIRIPRRARIGRWLGLLQQAVQSRPASQAAAWLRLQAVRVLGGAGERRHPGDGVLGYAVGA